MFLIVVYNSGFAMPEAQRNFAEELRQGCKEVFKAQEFAVCVSQSIMRPEDPTFVIVEGFRRLSGSIALAMKIEKMVKKLHQAAGLNKDIFVKAKVSSSDNDWPAYR